MQNTWNEIKQQARNVSKLVLSQKRGWRKNRGAHLFLAIVVFSVTLCARFSLTVHIFNSMVQFFSHSFACLRFCVNKQKKWLKRWTMGLKMCTVERKMRTDCEWKDNYCKKQSLSVYFFVFFLAATFLLWFGGLYKFSVPFSLSVHVPRVSNWFWQTMFLLHAKTWLVKIKWGHGELELIVKREQRICTSPQIIAKKWLSFGAVPPFFLWVGFLRAHLVPDVSFWWAPLLGLFCLRHVRI